ncbi:monosaccharide ABC transporter membrane protein (CUT2 family) [Rhizobium sp. PP-F2F-G38]|uniref:ABC transporter permease n=1 Tax=Rhizobium sp. PP-CC-3G-465 TaxID=2135648 RepID=UPI000D84DA7D|nr:monosaccharide ABC transporter membrane protein (CUT2 family) [Rhizobium sp. PP-WC-1G-195]PYE39511.1 monosaccharide ABC transporter membrane protein (CUT2 family) [Rhizobium sp. PP-F2F-G20b]PYE93327.1 monosaccharide ABC transporter membrane protein (CUT2 family) [Rhizobium sp. PP-F2F-G38]TCP75616.1 monosaccharide ABC transporter membrane protein (CUT2 family) [Rhizobium sp. PP-CC-2G-626]TCQ02546.1 monosaccharide ABC transporter membrane protein (CUT2 family) [Rhizobium sp. PP-F2F-G36]TCQ172
MSNTVNSNTTAQDRGSLFKKHENLTVLSIFAGFVVVIVALQLIMTGGSKFPTFISPVNILNILQQVAVPGIIAVGMTMVMISGGIDLSVGMLASLVSIVVALAISQWGFSIGAAILLGVGCAVLLEAIMGFIISRTSIEPFIITLGGMISFQGIALLLSNSREVVMKGELDFLTVNLLDGMQDPVTGLVLRLPPYVLLFFVITLLGGLLLTYTTYGRRLYAVGTNPRAAFLAGIDVRMMRLSVYLIQGLLVGVGATMLLARINTGIITLGQNLEIDTIAMVVIGGTALSGGRGSIVGTLIGVLFLGSIANAMNLLRLPSEVQFLAKGLIVIIAVSMGDVSARVSHFRAFRRDQSTARAAAARAIEEGSAKMKI